MGLFDSHKQENTSGNNIQYNYDNSVHNTNYVLNNYYPTSNTNSDNDGLYALIFFIILFGGFLLSSYINVFYILNKYFLIFVVVLLFFVIIATVYIFKSTRDFKPKILFITQSISSVVLFIIWKFQGYNKAIFKLINSMQKKFVISILNNTTDSVTVIIYSILQLSSLVLMLYIFDVDMWIFKRKVYWNNQQLVCYVIIIIFMWLSHNLSIINL